MANLYKFPMIIPEVFQSFHTNRQKKKTLYIYINPKLFKSLFFSDFLRYFFKRSGATYLVLKIKKSVSSVILLSSVSTSSWINDKMKQMGLSTSHTISLRLKCTVEMWFSKTLLISGQLREGRFIDTAYRWLNQWLLPRGTLI